MKTSVIFALVGAVLGLFACSVGGGSDANTFTLYRNSVTNENMRIHVATFDADEKEEYNRGNCEQAQALFQAQPGIRVKYWCEKGRFRK